MAVPIGAEDEDKLIYFIGDADIQQISDIIIAYN
jgi:hypothetical protein